MTTKYDRADDQSDALIQESRELIGQLRSLAEGLDRVTEALHAEQQRRRKGGA